MPDPNIAVNLAATTDMPAPSTVDDDRPLTADEYRLGMDMVVNAANLLQIVPIDRLRAEIERTETLAPILDATAYPETLAPILDATAYQRGAAGLRDQRELLDAAAQLRSAVDRIKARHPELGHG